MNYKYFKNKEDYTVWYKPKKYFIKDYKEVGKGILIQYIVRKR